MERNRSRTDVIAAIGLAIGGALGLAGTFVPLAEARQILWGIDGVGIVVACVLLTLKYFRLGSDLAAAGFLVFGIGEALLVSGNSAGVAGSAPSFAGGVLLWAAGLMMIGAAGVFAAWIRYVGMFAAILFAVTAARMHLGEPITALSSPLPFFAYPFLVITFGGWIYTLIRGNAAGDGVGSTTNR